MVHFDQRIQKANFVRYRLSFNEQKQVPGFGMTQYMKDLEFLPWYTSIKEIRRKHLSNTFFQLTQRSSWCFRMTSDITDFKFLPGYNFTKEFRKNLSSNTVFQLTQISSRCGMTSDINNLKYRLRYICVLLPHLRNPKTIDPNTILEFQ